MNNMKKKLMICALAGIMQVGIGAATIEASPLHNDGTQRIVQLDDRDHDNDRQREHDRRQYEERDRHEREMRRHEHESEREWHERQDRENERHNNTMNEIEAGLVGFVLGSLVN